MNRRLPAVAPYSADAVFTGSDLGAAAARSVGHCPWSEEAPGLRILDVLVLPSYEEPFGTVLAEAMAVGTRVVATRVDGLPEDGVERVEGLIAA